MDDLFNSRMLSVILMSDNTNLIKHIIDHLDNLELPDAKGAQLISYICYHNSPELVRYMLDVKKVCINNSNHNGKRPIHYLCRDSKLDAIVCAVEHGAKLDCATNKGWKPIHYACMYNSPEVIRYLVNCTQGTLSSMNNDNYTPFHIACKHQPMGIIAYMISKGANPLEPTGGGQTIIDLMKENFYIFPDIAADGKSNKSKV